MGKATMSSCCWLACLSAAEIREALSQYVDDGHTSVLVFLPETELHRVGVLQAQSRELGIAVAGAVFPELVVDAELQNEGAILLGLGTAPVPLLIEQVGYAESIAQVTEKLVGYVNTELAGTMPASLFCIFDALIPNIATHLDAWYLTLADRVSYFGVNAGNDRFTPEPCLFDGDRFVQGGVLFLLLPGHLGATLSHGYGVPEQAISATSTEGNCISQINWRPALEVYADLMLSQYGVAITRENFYEHAVHFPFGILRADGEVLVRIPVSLDEDGQIFCVGEIPDNSILTLLDARCGSQNAPANLVAGLVEKGGWVDGDDLMLFYCAGRRMHLGDGMLAELRNVADSTHARHVFGALSLGEIGSDRLGGYPLFHNATLVGVPCPKQTTII
jgi:hypothetical protein